MTRRAADTLHNATALLDPVWGGMYQYSVGGHWSEPHFEKLISIQATALREYSLAYAQTQNREDLQAAQSVHRYVTNFLESPASGAFFVSQDADLHDGEENAAYFELTDAGRRAQGIPHIDKHVYARENGWMIAALCDYYAATGDGSALAQARRAAELDRDASQLAAAAAFATAMPMPRGRTSAIRWRWGRHFWRCIT